MKLLDMSPAEKIAYYMTRLYDNRLTTTSGGNLSIIDSEGRIRISPSGIDKAHLTADDILSVGPDGRISGKHRPSSEFPFHLAVLKARPDLKAVFHAHPPALDAFCIDRTLPPVNILPGLVSLCGGIAVAGYALPGSGLLGDRIAEKFAAGCNTVLLENHGVVIGAESLEKAFLIFEDLEYAMRTLIAASMLGKAPRLLSDAELALYEHHEPLPAGAPAGNAEDAQVRGEIVSTVRRYCSRGLFTSATGAFASRTADRKGFIITPGGEDNALLTPDMTARIENGVCECGRVPSAFARLFSEIFEAHPDIVSLAAARPPRAMAFALTGTHFDARVHSEGYVFLRRISRHPFGTAVTDP
ncbi:MAG: class II aldolase/adducin family protein, partial [Clostridia bacterium]|nr:class II aldolase/adducin family protein [Clostridia bacterium]